MPTQTIASTDVWVSEIVDNTAGAGIHASLKLDSAGRPNIAYWTDIESPQAVLKLARKEGAAWTIDVAAAVRGAAAALAIDAHDQPWIAYYDLETSAIKAAHRESGVWRLEVIASDLRGFAVGNASITLTTDRPAVSFWSDDGLQVARRSATGNWQVSTVDANVRAGIASSLATDAAGNLHIAYYDLATESLKHASLMGQTWVTETVDSDPSGYVGEQCSLAIHSASGQLHIVYSSRTGLRHARFEGSWQIESLDSGSGVGMFPSLALDQQGQPVAGYYDSVQGTLKVFQSGAVTTVDASSDVGGYASLVLDAEGHGRIAYHDWTHRSLQFARSVAAPKASIVRVQGGTPRLFELDGSGSTGDSLKFEWNVNQTNVAAFPGGQNNPRLSVQFTGSPGTYTFTLKITDAQQRQDTASFNVVVT